MPDLYFYNSLTRKKEKFVPVEEGKAKIYNCGPTVYWDVHIGNLLSFTFRDVLARTLLWFGYDVFSVMNITDVGHLVSDEDTGEDKLEKQAKKEGKTTEEIAETYIKKIFGDLSLPEYSKDSAFGKMNILRHNVVCKATEHILEMIKMIKTLEQKGYVYKTELGVYFDVSKFKNYGKLSGQSLAEKMTLVREDLVEDSGKKHPADFALWLFTKGIHAHHKMKWDSPWGEGFPGWHIECSAMSHKYLGLPMDFHTGGVDNLPVHHENEIAQTECAHDAKMANFWLHNEYNLVDGTKMSKSKGNSYVLEDIETKGYKPLALRYLFLTSHYRSQLNFTWESLKASQKAYDELSGLVKTWSYRIANGTDVMLATKGVRLPKPKIEELNIGSRCNEFAKYLSDDLGMPGALGIVWKIVKNESIETKDKLELILDFDKVMGLRLGEVSENMDVSEGEEIDKLVSERENLRKYSKWEDADKKRDAIESKGVALEDTDNGPVWHWVS